MIYNKKDMDSRQRFSIRKLSVGVCSVLLSTLFLSFNSNSVVKAASEEGNQTVQPATTQVEEKSEITNSEKATADESKQDTPSETTATEASNATSSNEVSQNSKQSDVNTTQTGDETPTSDHKQGNNLSTQSKAEISKPESRAAIAPTPDPNKQPHFTIDVYDETAKKNIYSYNVVNPDFSGYRNLTVNGKVDGHNPSDYISTGISGVPTGVNIKASYWESFSSPTAVWWYPNFKWDSDEAKNALLGSTVTISVKHRTRQTQQYQTRQITVNYEKVKVNDDGSYTEDGNAFDPAVLDIYYTRTATEDLVTHEFTYSPWQWDTNRGYLTPGFNRISGTWSGLSKEWGSVSAEVKPLTGYTIYLGGPSDNINHIPANEFVHPTWLPTGETGNADSTSLVYTDNAPIYEAKSTHTVLYIPNKTTQSTVVGKFLIAGGDRDGQEYAPEAKARVFYYKTGNLNPQTNKITYGDWQFDKNAGDPSTPGFHVISGNWSSDLETGATGGFTVIPPAGNDQYTQVTESVHQWVPGFDFNTRQFANPVTTTFPDDTDTTWYNRNTLITYYVPNSELNKTITRTITIKAPDEPTRIITQTATLQRDARVNDDDSGVVFDGFDRSGWKAAKSWGYQAVPAPAGYDISVVQSVDGKTNPIELVFGYGFGYIPAGVINENTKDSQVMVTYSATASAELVGMGSSVYNGQAITNDDLNQGLHVVITGPTANQSNYVLQTGDVEFSTDGQNWTTQMPINAGKYQVRLTDQAVSGIKNQFGNNSISWENDGKETITSDATYEITPVSSDAVIANTSAGNYTEPYNGAAFNLIDPSKFDFTATVGATSVKLDATGLTSDDFSWADNIAPIAAGNYQIKLNDAGLAKLQKNNPNFKLTSAGYGTFTITPIAASAILMGHHIRPYDGQVAALDKLPYFITRGLIAGQTLNTTHLTLNDFEWVDQKGQTIKAPSDAGTYYLVLSAQGLAQLQKDNPNYQLTEKGKLEYVIRLKLGGVILSGNQENTTVNISNNQYSLTGSEGLVIPADISFEFADGIPDQSGVYDLVLTPDSERALSDANPNYALSFSSNAKFTLAATAEFVFQDLDENNKQVGQVLTKSGVAGSTITNLDLAIPAGYELAPNEPILSEYTFTKSLKQTTVIKLVHKTIEVTTQTPEKDIPTGPVLGDQSKNYEKLDRLFSEPTRTIVIINPDGKKQVIDQKVKFTRTATFDAVTGKVTYSDWKLAQDSKSEWDAYSPQEISGYDIHIEQKSADKVATIKSIDQTAVSFDTANVMVTIAYDQLSSAQDSENSDHDAVDNSNNPADNAAAITSTETVNNDEDNISPKGQDIQSDSAKTEDHKEAKKVEKVKKVLHKSKNTKANVAKIKQVKNTKVSTTQKTKTINSKQTNDKQLPQTGEKDSIAAILGIASVALGLFVLINRKKEE